MGDSLRWYCAYTQPHLERWARTNLWERGYEVYLPEYRKRRSHARKTEIVARPLFPRYLFVRADFAASGRRAIRMARGVVDLVTFGSETPAIADDVIAALRMREGADGYIVLDDPRTLKPGEAVRITDGPFADHVGVFQNASDAERVFVLLTIMGRAVQARLPAAAIERAVGAAG